MAYPRPILMTLLASGSLVAAALLMAFQGTRAQAQAWPAASEPPAQAARLASSSPEFGIDLPVRMPAFNAQQEPALAFDGTHYLAVWVDHRESHRRGVDAMSTLMGARVGRDGQVMDAFGFEIASAPYYHATPAVAFDGTNSLVVWERQPTSSTTSNIYTVRVSPSGQVLDSTSMALASSSVRQESPQVAFDGTHFLVVWNELRTFSNPDVYGARVGRDGRRIGAAFPIATGVSSEFRPTVAFGGSEFLVVWSDARSGVSGATDLYGTRISTSGMVLDPGGRRIISAPGSQYSPALVSDGTQYLLTWSDGRALLPDGGVPPTETYVARLARDGTPVSGSERVLSPGGNQASPVIAAARDGYLVTWLEYRPTGRVMSVVRLDSAGAPVSTTELPMGLPAPQSKPLAVASDGEAFLLAWAEEQPQPRSVDVFARVVGAGGELPSTPGVLLSAMPNRQTQPSVAFDGERYVVAWVDGRNAPDAGQDIYAARVGADGALLDPAAVPVTTAPRDQTAPSIACESGQCLVVWEDSRDAGTTPKTEVYAARLSPDAGVLAVRELLLTPGVGERHQPVVASDGRQYQVVWEEFISGEGARLLGRRIPYEGSPNDEAPVTIATGAAGYVQKAIATLGDLSLVVWAGRRNSSFHDLYAARLTSDGVVLEPEGQPLLRSLWSKFNPAVSAEDGGFLVVWQDDRNFDSSDYDLYSARVLQDGGMPDGTGRRLAIAPGYQTEPALAFNGAHHVAVWTDTRDDLAGDTLREQHVFGQLIPVGGGDLTDARFSVASTPSAQSAPVEASDGQGRTLVVYERKDPYGSPRLRARWVGDGLANGRSCAVSGECASGSCVDGVCCDTACAGGVCDACSVAAGALVDGVCAPLNGRSCDDGNACSSADTCQAGTCGGRAYQCSRGACEQSSTCDGLGGCLVVPRPEGSACNDGNACTMPDACQAGVCVGTVSSVCEDAGTAPPRDAGTEPGQDAGAGPAPDAGTQPPQDAGTPPSQDAGTSPPPQEESSGCGCGATSGGFELALALGAAALMRRRRS
ncbi:hypothetical protein ACLESD_19380 [Pyxidicoccus sp. 3LFB2]